MTGSAATRRRLQGAVSTEVFRRLLDAATAPGSTVILPHAVTPPGLHPATLLPLVLADLDTRIAVDDLGPDDDPVPAILASTGARLVPLEAAEIVVVHRPRAEDLRRCRTGSATRPEQGAKVALGVDHLAEVASTPAAVDHPPPSAIVVKCTGPGVPGSRLLAVGGLDPAVVGALGELNAAFPAGIDCWLFDPDGRVAALLRTTRLEVVAGDGSDPVRSNGGD